MKCPQCSFVCSELRDICPKCLLDLRPHKESLGLTITDPASSYQHLLSTIGEQPRPPAPKRKSGVFSKIFGRPEPKLVGKGKQEGSGRINQKTPAAVASATVDSPTLLNHSEPTELFIKLPEETLPVRTGEGLSSLSAQETASALSDLKTQQALDELTPLPLDDRLEAMSEDVTSWTTTEEEPKPISLEESLIDPVSTSAGESPRVVTKEVKPLDASLPESMAVQPTTTTESSTDSRVDAPRTNLAGIIDLEEIPSFFDNHETATPPVERTVAELFGVESKPYFPKEFTYSGQLDEPGSFFDNPTPPQPTLTTHTSNRHGVEPSATRPLANKVAPKTKETLETLPLSSSPNESDMRAQLSSSLSNEEVSTVGPLQDKIQSDETDSYLEPTTKQNVESEIFEISSEEFLEEAEVEVEAESSSEILFEDQDLTDPPSPPVYILDIDLDDVEEESASTGVSSNVLSTTPLQAVESTSATDVVETSYEFSPVLGSATEAISYVKFRDAVEEESAETKSSSQESSTIPPAISEPISLKAREQTEEASSSDHEDELSDEDFSFEIPTRVLKEETARSLQSYSEDAEPTSTDEEFGRQPSHHVGSEDLASQSLLPKSEPLPSQGRPKPSLPEDLDNSQRIRLLFEATDRELQENEVLGEISLSFDQLAERERSEMLELYFDLADEAISNPMREHSFEEKVIKSDQRQIASGLTEQAVEVEKEIAIIRREKARAARKEERYSTITRKRLAKEIPPKPIGWMRRTLCSIVDLSLISLCCLAAVTVSHLLSSPDFLTSVKMMEIPSLVDIIYICGLFCALLPITTVSYQAAMLTMFEQTFGMMLFRIEVAREDGDLPSVSQLVLRALTFPFSALLLGFLPPFFGRRSLTDHLARTILIHRRELA